MVRPLGMDKDSHMEWQIDGQTFNDHLIDVYEYREYRDDDSIGSKFINDSLLTLPRISRRSSRSNIRHKPAANRTPMHSAIDASPHSSITTDHTRRLIDDNHHPYSMQSGVLGGITSHVTEYARPTLNRYSISISATPSVTTDGLTDGMLYGWSSDGHAGRSPRSLCVMAPIMAGCNSTFSSLGQTSISTSVALQRCAIGDRWPRQYGHVAASNVLPRTHAAAELTLCSVAWQSRTHKPTRSCSSHCLCSSSATLMNSKRSKSTVGHRLVGRRHVTRHVLVGVVSTPSQSDRVS